MKEGTHELPGSGGKHKLGETESQMPHRNSRKNLNGTAGSQDNPSSDTGRGYTDADYFGPGMGKDNMKIKKTNR
jgi:hypothetical protein